MREVRIYASNLTGTSRGGGGDGEGGRENRVGEGERS